MDSQRGRQGVGLALHPASAGGTPSCLCTCCRLQGRVDGSGPAGSANSLLLGADAPSWVYSTAPLATPDGKRMMPPWPGSAGYAMFLSDQQVGGCVCVCACVCALKCSKCSVVDLFFLLGVFVRARVVPTAVVV